MRSGHIQKTESYSIYNTIPMFWLLRQSPSTSEDESGSTSEESHAGYATARLSALSLESLHCLGGSPDQSSYAANGMNRKRMKTALKHPCACNCSVPLTLGKNMFDFLGAAKVWSRCCSLVVASQHWRYENSVDDRRIGWCFFQYWSTYGFFLCLKE